MAAASPVTSKTVSFSELPPEIQVPIASQLSLKDLASFALTSKESVSIAMAVLCSNDPSSQSASAPDLSQRASQSTPACSSGGSSSSSEPKVEIEVRAEQILREAWREMGYLPRAIPREISFAPKFLEFQDKALVAAWPKMCATLPPHIRNLSSISEIRMALKTNPTISEEFSRIETLDLRGLKLEVVPEEIRLFCNLRKLDLSSNALRAFPFSDKDFPKLSFLDLASNQLSSYPPLMPRFGGSQFLFSNNQLKTAPPFLPYFRTGTPRETHRGTTAYESPIFYQNNPLLFDHHQSIQPLQNGEDVADTLSFFQFQAKDYPLTSFPKLPEHCLSRFYFTLLNQAIPCDYTYFSSEVDEKTWEQLSQLPAADQTVIREEIEKLGGAASCPMSVLHAAVHNAILRKYFEANQAWQQTREYQSTNAWFGFEKIEPRILEQIDQIERDLNPYASPDEIESKTRAKTPYSYGGYVAVPAVQHNLPRLALALDLREFSRDSERIG